MKLHIKKAFIVRVLPNIKDWEGIMKDPVSVEELSSVYKIPGVEDSVAEILTLGPLSLCPITL